MRVIQHTVPVRDVSQRYTVDATEPVPGLLVYEIPDVAHCSGLGHDHWRVAHHSGLLIAACQDEHDAEFIAQTIADFTDWTRSADELRADTSLDITDLYERITYETPGIFVSSKDPQAAA
ncbi:hypothetical protein [Streptomyces sp. NPDC051310]|uniref:hypothetical protein n=1 Tax=Streptomyces sp. NPDC051310 TaxID=3365649 RepID=UPI0037AEAC4D